jgi:hypothetical protein
LSQDDTILKELFEVRKIRKWSEISRIMQEQFGIAARNGKQCRERYHNHLRRGINKEKWTRPEEALLIDLHAQFGNRWALISKQIDGRYSPLHSGLRTVSRICSTPNYARPSASSADSSFYITAGRLRKSNSLLSIDSSSSPKTPIRRRQGSGMRWKCWLSVSLLRFRTEE